MKNEGGKQHLPLKFSDKVERGVIKTQKTFLKAELVLIVYTCAIL